MKELKKVDVRPWLAALKPRRALWLLIAHEVVEKGQKKEMGRDVYIITLSAHRRLMRVLHAMVSRFRAYYDDSGMLSRDTISPPAPRTSEPRRQFSAKGKLRSEDHQDLGTSRPRLGKVLVLHDSFSNIA